MVQHPCRMPSIKERAVKARTHCLRVVVLANVARLLHVIRDLMVRCENGRRKCSAILLLICSRNARM